MNSDANENAREHISSLMDGEVSSEAGRFLVRRLGADRELSAIWARYHIVRDCLRHQEENFAGDEFCARVRQALNEGQGSRQMARRRSLGWLKPVAGLAVAASVALMAVTAVGPALDGARQGSGEVTASADSQPFTTPPAYGPRPVSQPVAYSGLPAASRRMNSYLLRHYQATGSNGGGLVGFVPIVVTRTAPVAEAKDKSAQGQETPAKQEQGNASDR